jgi:hypothetical protein
MHFSTWLTMVLVTAFVWGGFGYLLAKAWRKESRKREP